MRKTSYNGTSNSQVNRTTLTVGSNFKFQNVQRLNTIVGQITQRQKQSLNPTLNPTNISRVGMSDKVLDMIKTRIKSNYQKLYSNYDDNKQIILKQLKEVQQTNYISGGGNNENIRGMESYIKQKSQYDKMKSQVEMKQKKLKKLKDVRDQLKGIPNQNNEMSDVLMQKCNLIQNLEEYKQNLDYQTAILSNMKSQRQQIKLYLKEKYSKTLQQQQNKKQRIKNLQNTNHNKKAILARIQSQLKKQSHCQLPENLAQELQKKLLQYEGKHTFQAIKKHEIQLAQQLKKQQQFLLQQEKQQERKRLLLKQKEQKKEYELAYNFYLIKQQQQQKIKKMAGVSSLKEIANNSLHTDYENLQVIKKEIERSIVQVKEENNRIKKEIQQILEGKDKYENQDLLEVEEEYYKVERELKAIEQHARKKKAMMNDWQAVIQLMTKKQVTKQNMGETLKRIFDKLTNNNQQENQKRFSLDNLQNHDYPQLLTRKIKKIKEQYQSECSIIENSLSY